MNYQIITFGCQFNKSDAERVAAVLEKMGFKKSGNFKNADLVLVLACSVRQSAVDRLFGFKGKWQERKPKITILSGCVLKTDKKKLGEFFDLILPINELENLPKLLKRCHCDPDERSAVGGSNPIVSDDKVRLLRCFASRNDTSIDYFKIHPSYSSKFSVSVPIMAGCNNFCSYCVVPYVRGREVSRPVEEIINECQSLIKKGYKEITLIGQNVNSYQNSPLRRRRGAGGEAGGLFPPHPTPLPPGERGTAVNFPKLLKMIDEIPGDYWLRFMTSHPKDLSDELIKVMAEGKHIKPYLHLPVQAGDDEILKKMNRGYTIEYYKNLIRDIRDRIREISVSTDVIVGFPGETKRQFANTKKLFEEIKFDMAYIAQYSPRSGTAAAKLKDNVPRDEKKRRHQILTEVLKKTALQNNKKLIGKTEKVLVENYKNGFCFGKTAGFKTVRFSGKKELIGEFVGVEIKEINPFGLKGTFNL